MELEMFKRIYAVYIETKKFSIIKKYILKKMGKIIGSHIHIKGESFAMKPTHKLEALSSEVGND